MRITDAYITEQTDGLLVQIAVSSLTTKHIFFKKSDGWTKPLLEDALSKLYYNF